MSQYHSPIHLPAVSTESADAFLNRTAAYVRHAPFALAVRELNRLLAMEILDAQQPKLRSPVLDVGCGDGFWWSLPGRHRPEVYGVDISEREIAQAKKHIDAELCDISRSVPFPGHKFQDIIGNCSLEHVRDIDSALKNLFRCAADDARLVLFVPAPEWAFRGRTQQALMKLSPRLAMLASGMVNGFFQHWHLYSPEVWAAILERNGWTLKTVYGLGNERSEFLFRLFLPPAFLGFLAKEQWAFIPTAFLKPSPIRSSPRCNNFSNGGSPHLWCRLMIPGSMNSCWYARERMARSKDYFSNHGRVRTFPWSLYHAPLEKSLQSFIHRRSAGRQTLDVLVIGCGLMQELEQMPSNVRITAIDIDERAVQVLAAVGDPRIVATKAVTAGQDLREIGDFDAVYAKEVIEHILDPDRYVGQLMAILRPGGGVWLSTPNYGEPWLPLVEPTFLELVARLSGFTRKGIHPTPFSKRRLRDTLEAAGFQNVKVASTSLRLALVGQGEKPPEH